MKAFATGIRSEIHQIAWPSAKKTARNVMIVIGMSAVLAAVTIASDFLAGAGFQAFLNLI